MNIEHKTNGPPAAFSRRLLTGLGCAAGSGLVVGFWVGAHSLIQNPTITGFANGALTLLFFGLLLAALSLPVGLAMGVLCQLLSFVGRPRHARFDHAVCLGAMAALFWLADAWDRSYVAQQLIRTRAASLTITRDEARMELYLLIALALGVGLLAGFLFHLALRVGPGAERPGSRARFLLALASLAAVAAAVFRPAPEFYPPKLTPEMARANGFKVHLVVIDGADWRFIDPLLAQGGLPNLQALIERGVRAPLGVTYPSESPHMWTALSTGLEDDVTGLCEFYAFKPPGTDALITRFPGLGDARRLLFRLGILRLKRWGLGSVVPASSSQKRVPEIWDYLGDAGKTVAVVGWRFSAPVTEVNGVLVSDEFGERSAPYSLLWPEDLEVRTDLADEVERQVAIVAGGRDIEEALNELSPDARRKARRNLEGLRRNLERDLMYTHATLAARASFDPDFTATAARAIDGAEHVGMAEHVLHRMPDRPPLEEPLSRFTTEEAIETGGDIIENLYEVADDLLGTLLADTGDDLIIVISDHGHDLDGSGHRFGPPGILVMAGGPVAAGAELDPATVFDILPTTLHAAGLPVPAGLHGRVLVEAFASTWMDEHPVEVIVTDASEARVMTRDAAAGELSDELLEELERLGYVDG